MTPTAQMNRPSAAGSPARRVLDEIARRRRLTIRLPEDLSWLEEITPAPRRLVSHMHQRGHLHLVGDGRYLVAPAGTASLEQAAPPELIADLLLRPYGAYYIGFLSSLIAHRLTDLHSETTYAAVRHGTRPRTRAPLSLNVVELSDSAWPPDDGDAIERFRAVEGTKEFAYRASLERSLVDGLLRPDLCAGFETVVLAWSRARRRADVSWDRVADLAGGIGAASARRAAFMLRLLDLDAVVERRLGHLEVRKASTPLDRGNGFGLGRREIERDAATGVLLNVPREYLRGWVHNETIA